MAEDTQLTHLPQGTPHERATDSSVAHYARGLRHHAPIAELILSLEAIAAGQQPTEAAALAQIARLTEATGLNLEDPQAIQAAILALGERAEALASLRRNASAPPSLARRDVPSVVSGLLYVLEAARARWQGDISFESHLDDEARWALSAYEEQHPATTPEGKAWWDELRQLSHTVIVPTYAAIAPRLTALEDHPIKGPLLRSRALMAALCAAPALLTLPLPIPTGLVATLLALFGGLALHPMWVAHVASPLRRLGEAMGSLSPLIERRSGEKAWREEDFSVASVAQDVTPLLEARLQEGIYTEEELRPVVSAYFDSLEAPFETDSSRSPRYLHHLRAYFEGKALRQWSRYAAARRRLQGRPWVIALDRPWLSALMVACVTLPIDWLAARLSPLPQPIDLPVLFALFAALGAALPRMVGGTEPSRRALIAEIEGAQGDIDELP